MRENDATDEIWKQVKEGAEEALGRAEQARKDGRRNLALLRFAAVHENLAAAAYLGERTPEQRKDAAAFEAEWKRMGTLLLEDASALSPAGVRDLRAAALRAMRETALPQVKNYYDASHDYGRSTMLDTGLFYLGAAKAWKDFAAFTDEMAAAPAATSAKALAAPPLRGLESELDDLENEFLAAYRPPASIDKHRDFIVASSELKEARDLEAAGMHHGALLRYLQAAMDFAPLRPGSKPADASAVAAQLKPLEERLTAGGIDHSIGQLFLEIAQAGLEDNSSEAGPGRAAAIAGDILPRYFAALEPARARPPRPEAQVTVTLVRWPYT